MFTQNEEVLSFIASGDLSTHRNRIVSMVGQFKVGHALADQSLGVLLENTKTGEHAPVVVGGVTMVFVGAAVTANDVLTSAASGWAVKVTSGNGTNVLGRALTTAASGMLCSVLVTPYYRPNSVGN